MPRSSRLALLLAVAVAVAVAGCAFGEIFDSHGDPVTLTTEDLVGTWCSNARSITFADSGEFTAKDLPRPLFQDHAPPDGSPIDGAGDWTVSGSTVSLHFTTIAGTTVSGGDELTALRQKSGKVFLFFFYVDQGNSWTSYEKC